MTMLRPHQLDQLIGSWLLDLKKQNSDEYEPSTISAYFNRLGVHIKKHMDIDIHDDREFALSKQVLFAKKRT